MGIFNDLFGMIETVRAKVAPHDALSSSRKLILPEMWYGVHRVSHLPQLILCPVIDNMAMRLTIFQISLTKVRE